MKRSDHPFHKNRAQVSTKNLTQEIARPSLTGLRQVWTPSVVANGLTPQRLACILRDAEVGQHHEQLELAEAMEERDAHYGSVLRTRRLAIQGLEITVESYSDDDRDIEIADLLRDVIRRPEFDELLDDLTDALGKGYAAVLIDWQMGKTWRPTYRWCDPRWFVWDQVSGRELRLRDEVDPTNGVELVPRRWIVHVPRIKSGLPSRSGLARLAAVAYMCKSWTLKDWMSFADTYGLPLRVGKYGPGASKEDINTLVSAVANIASDAGAVIPESMMIEFVQASQGTAGSNGMFEGLAKYLDAQISKAVLGHSGSSDSTPGKLGGDDQASEVRLDILKADAKQLAATLNRDLVRPLIDLNFGEQENYPQICIPVPEPEDTNLLVTALEKLVPLGFEVEQSVIRDKLGLPDPEMDDNGKPVGRLFTPQKTSVQPPATAENRATALNRATTEPDELDGLVNRLSEGADRVVEGWVGKLLDVVDEAIADGKSLADLPELAAGAL
ncbi:MAG: DUF935 domain-containing protein [Halioglobus sp.]